MGCGATAAKAAEPLEHPTADLVSVIIWGGKHLKKSDLATQSDPYVVARVGPKGSSWDEKCCGSGRRSHSIRSTANPEWNLGFTVDVHGMTDAELQVQVYDKDFATSDDLIGQGTIPLSQLTKDGMKAERHDIEVNVATEPGTLSVSGGPLGLLEAMGIKPSALYESLAPMGKQKMVKVEDITGDGPLRVGTAPLPSSIRGIFWLTAQKHRSALGSFGGPSNDGGGCSPGELTDGRCAVRVGGDRSWALADQKTGIFALNVDLIYHFVFNDGENPTKCQIYPEARKLGVTLTAEWVMDLEMELMQQEHPEYPGSVVWRRLSYVVGQDVGEEYALVQVMNENGERIEPAWTKFVEYQKSDVAGHSPGEIWYHEIA